MRLIIALLLMATTAPGCSIYKAATAPPSVPVDAVKVGSTRFEVMSVFGLPRSTEVGQTNERTDVFEFIDGNSQASKLRIVPYVAADLFTIGLAELVLWPVELSLLQGSEGRAVVTFDQENRAKTVQITKRDGTPWKAE
jgi:outer membrane protein assembly factor BamE (lipoprotein component of BamABCDE complex)